MKEVVLGGLAALLVASALLGALGFARLHSTLDRLHCVTFVLVGCSLPLVALAFVADGPSVRSFKVLAMVVVALIAGASVNQSVARAVFERDEAGERE